MGFGDAQIDALSEIKIKKSPSATEDDSKKLYAAKWFHVRTNSPKYHATKLILPKNFFQSHSSFSAIHEKIATETFQWRSIQGCYAAFS